ncbi:DUF2062 domain-containing protein [Tepidamorphus sp. 3E244]|uniref:DUF2062 domain-containing protein n=1 Tax=Tepidamorphus sp. 3E244 TaxID=3385498 RepID=UPI0038FC159B
MNYVKKRVLRMRATPHAIAAGFAAGAFASFSPLMGLHFLLAALIAWFTRGNIIASAFGTFIGNFFTFPLIWSATYSLGSGILGGGGRHHAATKLWEYFSWSDFSFATVWPLIKPMALGGVILGSIAWVIFYFPIRAAVRGYQTRRAAQIAGVRGAPEAAE